MSNGSYDAFAIVEVAFFPPPGEGAPGGWEPVSTLRDGWKDQSTGSTEFRLLGHLPSGTIEKIAQFRTHDEAAHLARSLNPSLPIHEEAFR